MLLSFFILPFSTSAIYSNVSAVSFWFDFKVLHLQLILYAQNSLFVFILLPELYEFGWVF